MPSRPTTVRIDQEIFPHLTARAKRAGLSVSEFIRETVYERLGEANDDLIQLEIENLRNELASMRGDFVKAVLVILTIAGSHKEFPRALAEEWVEQNLTNNGSRT